MNVSFRGAIHLGRPSGRGRSMPRCGRRSAVGSTCAVSLRRTGSCSSRIVVFVSRSLSGCVGRREGSGGGVTDQRQGLGSRTRECPLVLTRSAGSPARRCETPAAPHHAARPAHRWRDAPAMRRTALHGNDFHDPGSEWPRGRRRPGRDRSATLFLYSRRVRRPVLCPTASGVATDGA